MHLTNYAINKTSESFVRDDEEGGSKRYDNTEHICIADSTLALNTSQINSD